MSRLINHNTHTAHDPSKLCKTLLKNTQPRDYFAAKLGVGAFVPDSCRALIPPNNRPTIPKQICAYMRCVRVQNLLLYCIITTHECGALPCFPFNHKLMPRSYMHWLRLLEPLVSEYKTTSSIRIPFWRVLRVWLYMCLLSLPHASALHLHPVLWTQIANNGDICRRAKISAAPPPISHRRTKDTRDVYNNRGLPNTNTHTHMHSVANRFISPQ